MLNGVLQLIALLAAMDLNILCSCSLFTNHWDSSWDTQHTSHRYLYRAEITRILKLPASHSLSCRSNFCRCSGDWKLIAENFVDFYHIDAVHPELSRFRGLHILKTADDRTSFAPRWWRTNPIAGFLELMTTCHTKAWCETVSRLLNQPMNERPWWIAFFATEVTYPYISHSIQMVSCRYTAAWCCWAMSRHFGHLWTKCLQLEPTGLKSEVADVAGWSGWRWWPVCWLRDISFDWLWRARGPHLRHFFSRHVTNDRQSDTVALCVPEDLIGWLDC